MIKINKFSDQTEIVLLHPEYGTELKHDDGRYISITAYGMHSAFAQGLLNERLNKRIKNPNRKLTAEQSNEQATKFLADCTISLNNFDGLDLDDGVDWADGDPFELYSNHSWIKDQVDVAINDLGNFSTPDTTRRKKR